MPALAIAAALETHGQGLEPVLVGAVRGVEARILPTRDYRYHLLPSEPIYRRQWWKNIRWPMLAGHLLRRVDELLSSGASGCGARHRGIRLGPSGLARGPGRACPRRSRNRTPTRASPPAGSAGGCGTCISALPESRRLLRFGSRTQVFDTGNPIVPPTPERRPQAAKLFGLEPNARVVLVTGGSQGALAINRAVAGWLEAGGPSNACLIWVTGRGTYEEFRRFHHPPRVQVIDYFDPMADGYAVADLVISRAGMMTVAELCAWGLPSILIPLPTAAADHQTHNARVLAEAGASVLLPQSELTPQRLGEVVEGVVSDDGTREAMAKQAMARGKPEAAKEIVSNLLTLVG